VSKINILVSGTSKTFAPNVPVLKSCPEFALQFSADKFNLIPEGKCKFLILFNHERKIYRNFIKSGGNPRHAVLIRLEPDTVFPAQYKKRIEDNYGLVVSPGSNYNFSGSESFIGWPYKYHLNPAEPNSKDPDLRLALNRNTFDDLFSLENWKQRSHLLVMIAANKVSPESRSNYSIRRNLAKNADSRLLEVYGALWNESIYIKARHRLAVFVAAIKQGTYPDLWQIYASLFTNYQTTKGPIPDKHKLLRETKFNLIVENSNTIVTEKIFDALVNGSIPVYIGPNLNSFGMPNGVAIEVTGGISNIEALIESINDEEISLYLEAMKKFISSEYFRSNWPSEEVYKKIAMVVKNYLESIN